MTTANVAEIYCLSFKPAISTHLLPSMIYEEDGTTLSPVWSQFMISCGGTCLSVAICASVLRNLCCTALNSLQACLFSKQLSHDASPRPFIASMMQPNLWSD